MNGSRGWIPYVRTAVRCALLAALLVLAAVRPALAQWPTLLMFYGEPLTQPVFIDGPGTATFGDLFRPGVPGLSTTTAASMGSRPSVSVACFWGPSSDPAVNGVRNRADLKPEMAWQHARFYPATADAPAMLFVTAITKVLAPGRATPTRLAPVPTDLTQYLPGGPVPSAALALLALQRVPITATR